MRPSERTWFAMIVVATAALGCADPEGVDLRLVPDPNLNSEAQLLEVLDSIVLVVDSPDGLYPPGSEQSDGNVQIEDADSDPSDLEFVATFGVPEDHLPWIRLERGSLPDASLELRFLGLPAEAGAPAVVVGRVQGVHVGRPIEELAIPFNLRPELLPPRVTEVLPTDGSTLSGCEPLVQYVMFSRPVDPASLEGAITVEPGTLRAVRLDPSGLTAELVVTGLVDLSPGDALRLTLTVASTVTDLEGRRLDQVPAEPGDQPYARNLSLFCGPGMALPDMGCGITGTPQVCPFPRLACVDGYCVPGDCGGAACGDGSACDPATGRCEIDCRAWGDAEVCPSDRPRCDDTTGVCVR